MSKINYEVQAKNSTIEIIKKAKLTTGNILIVGCSTSEVLGDKIGTNSSKDVASEIFQGLLKACNEFGVYLAVQCCEHLNRAIVISGNAIQNAEVVNVIPMPKAGGSLATVAYENLESAVVLEEIKADAGLDIGFTMIGMHLKKVAVPVRLENDFIGKAKVLGARVRPKFIGGVRAVYNENLL